AFGVDAATPEAGRAAAPAETAGTACRPRYFSLDHLEQELEMVAFRRDRTLVQKTLHDPRDRVRSGRAPRAGRDLRRNHRLDHARIRDTVRGELGSRQIGAADRPGATAREGHEVVLPRRQLAVLDGR